MNVETVVVAAAKWLWDSYGKEIADTTVDKFKDKWVKFKWDNAEEVYRLRLRQFCSTVRVLGNPKPINLDEIFTDAYVLDKPTAFKRFDIQELQARAMDHDTFQATTEKRKPALSLALKKKRLFILGKPGAGKTTFLKYLALKSIDGQIPKTPIFVSLREWADSGIELLDFIIGQFEICSFPDPKTFILHLLSSGNALVLFDGLDEVNTEGNQRSQMITALTNFAKRYENVHICLTCRIAATDYSFDQFTYLEIADFDKKQQDKFVSKWYQDSKKNLERFQNEFEKNENKGLRDIARTPLLLTLLCLAFDETLSFPNRRVDLYKESIDALLKKWDSSRGIRRDEIYRKLSPARKEQMLARIAAENFEAGSYFVAQDKIEKQITKYLQQLPDTEGSPPDGDIVLKAMEAQHGILVERAHSIYSFSHLTFQEYFTARYIVENAADGTIERLIANHFEDDRWREVFLLSASLLDNADKFFNLFLGELRKILKNQKSSAQFFKWALKKASTNQEEIFDFLPSFVVLGLVAAFSDELIFNRFNREKQDGVGLLIESNNSEFGFAFSAPQPRMPIFDYSVVRYFTNALSTRKKKTAVASVNEGVIKSHGQRLIKGEEGVKILSDIIGTTLTKRDFESSKKITKAELSVINRYMKACSLFLSCLRLASVSDRKTIEKQLQSTIPAG